MNITILCVGKIKEAYYREALAEYAKRLSKYCRLNVTEVSDEQTPDKASDTEVAAILKKEEERILSKIPSGSYVVSLAIEGKKLDSVEFSSFIDDLGISGRSSICFVIGGSLGLSDNVKKCSDMLLSFSEMTFPHQLMRVILAEQIYRAYRIIKGEPYHK